MADTAQPITNRGAWLAQYRTSASQSRPNNQSATKLGLYAKAKSGHALRARRVRRLVAKLYDSLPWLQPGDMATARAWADLEHRSADMSAYLQEHGLVNPDTGEIRRILGEWRQTLALQLRYADALGLSPAARASLGVDVAKGKVYDLALAAASERRNGLGVAEDD